MWWPWCKNRWHRESAVKEYIQTGVPLDKTPCGGVTEIKFNKLKYNTCLRPSNVNWQCLTCAFWKSPQVSKSLGSTRTAPSRVPLVLHRGCFWTYPLFSCRYAHTTHIYTPTNQLPHLYLSPLPDYTHPWVWPYNRRPVPYYLHTDLIQETLCTVQSLCEISLSYVSMSAKSSSHKKIQLDLSWNLSSATE